MESYVGGERETEWNRQTNKLIAKMSSFSLSLSLFPTLYLPEIHAHIYTTHMCTQTNTEY